MWTCVGESPNESIDFYLADEKLQQAEQIYRQLGNQYYLAVALQNHGLILAKCGEYQQAYELLYDAMAICEEFGYTALHENISFNLNFL